MRGTRQGVPYERLWQEFATSHRLMIKMKLQNCKTVSAGDRLFNIQPHQYFIVKYVSNLERLHFQRPAFEPRSFV